MKKILLISLFLGGSLIGQAQNYWKGTVDSLWNKAANWSAGVVPDSTSFIRIDYFNTTHPLVLTQNVRVHRCDLQDNGSLSIGSFEFKSDSSLFNTSNISSSGGKIKSEFVQLGNNQFNGILTLEVMRGRLYGNTFHRQLTLIATVPPVEALYVSIYKPDTFKDETTFINKGIQNGITVGVQGDNTINFDTTVFEKKFTFRNDFTSGSATTAFGNGENIFPAKIIFKGKVVLEGTHSGSQQPVLAFINAEFRDTVKVTMSGGTVRFGVTNATPRSLIFYDDLLLDTPGTRVEFGDDATMAVMKSGSTVTVPSGRMTSGKLVFKRFRSVNTASQLIQLGGSGTDNTIGSQIETHDSTYFDGPVYLRADQIELKGGRFAGKTTVEQTGAASLATALNYAVITVSNTGGNRFMDSLTVINRRNVFWDWQNDSYAKGVKLVHAALGWGVIRFGTTAGMNLPELTLSSSTNAYPSGGIKIGKGAEPDSVILPAGKHINIQSFSRGDVGLFNLVQRGDTTTHSLTLTDSSSLYIERSVFQGRFAATTPVVGLASSVFKQFSSFIKTGNLPNSIVDDVTFYDSVNFIHQGTAGGILFGPRDSQLLKTGGSGSDSLLRVVAAIPSEFAVDHHPDRVLMKSGFEILPNARYSAVIGTAESTTTVGESLLPQVTPKSPNIAAMERYGEIPVSLYTGLPTIEIPLYEITMGSVSVPVKLTYHAGGNKVTDQASWVGLGWSLQAGGSISRQLRGSADELTNNSGVLGQTLPVLYPSYSCLTEQLKSDLSLYVDFGKDIERDVFSYRLPQQGNSFVLTPGGKGYTWLQPEASRLSYNSALSNFQLDTPDGVKYEFNEGESTYLPNGTTFRSAWYLSKIQGLKTADQIHFVYQSRPTITYPADITDTEVYYTDVSGTNQSMIIPGLKSISSSTTAPVIFDALLQQIHFPGGKIVFVADETNQQLQRVEIYGLNSATNEYSLMKQFELTYTVNERLLLEKVKWVDTNAAVVGQYSCSYNEQTLPSPTSRAKDYWGYYNGQTANTTLIPGQFLTANLYSSSGSTTLPVGGGNREPNETLMKARILTRLEYPTGGYTAFTYEAHRYLPATGPAQITGGLRIRQIISNDANGKTLTKTYRYGSSESGNGTFRDIMPKTYSTVQTYKHPILFGNGDVDYFYKLRVFSSAFTTTLTPFDGSVVTYPVVTEYEDDGSGALGKTVYTFKDDVADNLTLIIPAAKMNYVSRHWGRGQLLTKTVYGANGLKKLKQVNTYSTLLNSSTPALGYLTGKSEIRLNSESPNMMGCLLNDDVFTTIPYQWYYGRLQLTRSEEYRYDDENDSKYLYTKTETKVDTTYFQRVETRLWESDGSLLIQRMRYPQDFGSITGPTTNAAAGLQRLQQRNAVSVPVENITLRKLAGAGDTLVIGGTLTEFRTQLSVTNSDDALPIRMFVLEVPANASLTTGGYTVAGLSGNSLTKDFRYVERVSLSNYDPYNNLSRYSLTKGAVMELEYTTLLKDSIYHSFVTRETANKGGSIEYPTQYNYTVPLQGFKEMIAPNGLKTSFEYDAFSRLKRVKDHSGKLLKEYDYQYASVAGQNALKQFMPRVSMTTLTGNFEQYQTQLSYFDGLGRPLQSVAKQAGPGGQNDIVAGATVYDNFGRINKSYIPFANTGSGSLAALPGSVQGDTIPFSQVTEFEDSPLRRVRKNYGPGQAWRTAQKYGRMRYLMAGAGTVRQWVWESDGGAQSSGYYTDTTLTKTVQISEQGNLTITYHDNRGKLILQEQQADGGAWLRTGYVYDVFDRLAYVIPPKVYDGLTDFEESDAVFTDGLFGYHYDARGRVIEKHVPGAGWEHMVYDFLDRTVLRQNARQRTDTLWTYTKYDALERVVQTGKTINTSSRSTLQTQFDGIAVPYETTVGGNQSFPFTPGANDLQTENYYDSYSSLPGSGYASGGGYVTPHSSALGMTTGGKTRNAIDNGWLYWATYYDTRNRPVQQYRAHQLGAINRMDFDYTFAGEVTKYRTTYRRTGAGDLVVLYEYRYDHVGRKTGLFLTYDAQPKKQLARYEYDAVGRLVTKILQPADSAAVASITRSATPPANTDDVASQSVLLLPNFSVSPSTGQFYVARIAPGTALQRIQYSYHLRDYLLGINLDGTGQTALTDGRLFSMKLEYEADGTYYDGNIRKQSWRNAKDSLTRSYTYRYDPLQRLTSAVFAGGVTGENYSLDTVRYDKNGNLTQLWRKGKTGSGTYGYVDKLSYSYQSANSNRISEVNDAIANAGDVEMFKDVSGTDYTYWENGALKSDNNKGISAIKYNHLELTKRIEFTGKWIDYYYDGAGNKLRKMTSDGVKTDYVDAAVYQNDTLYQMAHHEGRYSKLGLEYSYTDHLGNVRLMFRDSSGVAAITQTEHFGAWGESLKSLNYYRGAAGKEQYVFTGHERDEDLGVFDAKARIYDPLVPRMWSIDSYADAFVHLTPYNYAMNNPVFNVDPSGDSSINVQDLNMRTFDVNNDVVQLPTFQVSGSSSNVTMRTVASAMPANIAFGMGAYSGLQQTGQFLSSLTTAQGWKDLGQGFVNMTRMGNPADLGGIMMRAEMAMAVDAYAENIPDMTAGEVAYDFGYASEKVGEAVLTRKVMPVTKASLGLRRGLGSATPYTNMISYGLNGRMGRLPFRVSTPIVGLSAKSNDVGLILSRNLVTPIGYGIGVSQLQHIQKRK